MPMSRKAKIWLFIAAIPIVVVIAAIVALKVMFTSDRLKSMIIPRVEESTGRKVTIDDVSLSVFPSIAVKMDGVSISNRSGEGFSPGPFLTLEGLRLNVKLLPLLRSRVEVTALELTAPHLLLEVNAHNQTNYENLSAPGGAQSGPASRPQNAPAAAPESSEGKAPGSAPPSNAPKVPEPSPSSVAEFLVSNLHLDKGSIEYINYKDNSATRVRDLSLSMELGSQANSVIVSGSAETDSVSYGSVETPLVSGLRIRLDHRITYDVSDDLLKIDRGDITLQDIRLTLSGSVAHARSNAALDLTIGSDSLNIADLFSLIPKDYMKKAEGVKGKGIARIHIAVTGTMSPSTTADFAGTIAANGASIQYPQLAKPITDITILSSFSKTKAKQELRIEKLTANLGGGTLHMAMTVSDFNDPLLDLSAGGSLHLAELGEYYPLEKGTELGGDMTVDFHVAGKVSAMRSMRASGALTLKDVSVKTASSAKPLRELNGTLTFNNDVAETKKLSLLIGQSDFTLSCNVRNYLSVVLQDKKAPQCSASVTLQSRHLISADLMSGGQASGADAAKAGGHAAEAPITQKSAPAKTAQVSGKSAFPLPPVDIDAEATIGTLTLEKFEFTNIRGSMRVSKGVVTMQNLSLNAFGGGVVSNGSLDLNKPERPLFDLKLNLNGVEASTLLSHFTSFGARLNGAMTMSTNLKGALNDTVGLVPETLQGSGKVGVKNGSLKGFKVNQSLASQLKLPDLETIQFKDWTNDFTVQNGRLVLKDLTITSSTGQYVVNGSQGLDGTLDYHLALYMPASAGAKLNIPGFAGEAVNLFKDGSGRLKFDFNIGGTTDNPKVQLDTDPAKRKAEDMVKQKATDQLKKKASDVLKKLLKK